MVSLVTVPSQQTPRFRRRGVIFVYSLVDPTGTSNTGWFPVGCTGSASRKSAIPRSIAFFLPGVSGLMPDSVAESVVCGMPTIPANWYWCIPR
jgi:hypothetical protein